MVCIKRCQIKQFLHVVAAWIFFFCRYALFSGQQNHLAAQALQTILLWWLFTLRELGILTLFPESRQGQNFRFTAIIDIFTKTQTVRQVPTRHLPVMNQTCRKLVKQEPFIAALCLNDGTGGLLTVMSFFVRTHGWRFSLRIGNH